MNKWFTFTHDDPVQFLFLNDIILGPIFIFFVLKFCSAIIKTKKNPVYKKFFMSALIVRIVSAIIMAFVYQFYYNGGGDTHTYFIYALRIHEVLYENPSDFIKLMFYAPKDMFLLSKIFETGAAFFVEHGSNLVIRFTTVLTFLFFNSYILISFTYTLFCFYGCWKIFILFQKLYPHLEKEFALACLYLPSVCFWGTGIMKDPICLGALGLITYHGYMLFFEKTKTWSRFWVILLCAWLLKEIKFYILLSFIPAYTFWIAFRYTQTVTNKLLKTFVGSTIFVIFIILGGAILYKIAAFSQRYSFESIIRTAKDTQNWLYYSSQLQGGSSYSLGNLDYTLSGIIKVVPRAINVALFRPYLWEAKKAILIPAALEGLVSLYFTIRLLYKTGFIRFINLILTNPEVQFCMIFSMVFAFAVGFTSYNFGALVRYKIPLMPFFYIALFIMTDADKTPAKKSKKIKNSFGTKPTTNGINLIPV